MKYEQTNKQNTTTENINWSCSDNYDCIANCHIYLVDHKITAAGIALHYILHCIAPHRIALIRMQTSFWMSRCYWYVKMCWICSNWIIACLHLSINHHAVKLTRIEAPLCVFVCACSWWPCHLTDFESNA